MVACCACRIYVETKNLIASSGAFVLGSTAHEALKRQSVAAGRSYLKAIIKRNFSRTLVRLRSLRLGLTVVQISTKVTLLLASIALGGTASAQAIGFQSVGTGSWSGGGSLSTSITSGYYASETAYGSASGSLGANASAGWQGYWEFTFQLNGYAGPPASAPAVTCPGYTVYEGTAASTQAGGAPNLATSSTSAWADCSAYATNSYPPVQKPCYSPGSGWDIVATPFAVTMTWVPVRLLVWHGCRPTRLARTNAGDRQRNTRKLKRQRPGQLWDIVG
jgi:hypothetical protein